MRGIACVRPVDVVVGAAIAIVCLGLWAFVNRPALEPAWPERVAGVSYSPFGLADQPIKGDLPDLEQVARDFALLAGKVGAARIYSVKGTYADIPAIARAYGIKVTAGAFIEGNLAENERELRRLVELVRANPNINRVIVGNETLLRGEIYIGQLVNYLDRVRAAVDVPVSTAEPWHVWLKYPELARHVDYIAVHLLPYWEGVPLDSAVDFVSERMREMEAAFPGMPILIGEVGWPSNGRTRRDAVASVANEAKFLRRFLARIETAGYEYFLMEAFDQPWKRSLEGAVGAYWGIYDAKRNPKFEFSGPIVNTPGWPLLAGATIALALALSLLLLADSGRIRKRGRSFLTLLAYGAGAGLVLIVESFVNQYLTPLVVLVGLLLGAGLIGVVAVILTEGHELAEAMWVSARRRDFGRPAPASRLPKVSIHVPAYNEPPAMVIETLNAISRLDYPDFEVLVIDNNTKDPTTWRPVEDHCRALGERFRFFHVAPLSGFKAGALNFALRHTAPAAEIVAVVDSDYVVERDWLKDLVPHFANPAIAVVQAPQDYRDGGESRFKAMAYAEYAGFFHIGMVTRNDRNAIIEHGTMSLIRRSALEAVGGWANWCITEDAELGLRLIAHGYETAYVERSYGRGLMPDTFTDYRKQRYRWAYGAVQILRRYAGEILGLAPSRLTLGQRYHFVAGWLPWLADGLNLFFTVGALLWSAAIMLAPKHVDPPLEVYVWPAMVLFAFKLAKILYLYPGRVGATLAQTAGAALAGLALSHTIGKAVVQGVVTRDLGFFRTPKCENQPALVRAIVEVSEEAALTLALWTAAAGVAVAQGGDTPGVWMWVFALAVQSLPYLAAVLVALVNALPAARRRTEQPTPPVVARA
ncbi:MAG: glycosyltransferase [Proteobacteria bacterium]|nr:glycosyltransferase [Pseudomonadota bacterium]